MALSTPTLSESYSITSVLSWFEKIDISHFAFSINCKFLLVYSDVENILENTFFAALLRHVLRKRAKYLWKIISVTSHKNNIILQMQVAKMIFSVPDDTNTQVHRQQTSWKSITYMILFKDTGSK